MTDTVLLNISVMYYMCNVKIENKKNHKKTVNFDKNYSINHVM